MHCYPIIYVRGYAMRMKEVDETTADPFCGFNAGSTVYRARVLARDKNAPPSKFIFESPLIRLGSDFGYKDVYEDGLDITDKDWPPAGKPEGIAERSIIIYRYYEQASTLLGTGKVPDVETFARGLSELIERVRYLVEIGEDKVSKQDFRCYLVAHSMGGLVCRAFLQNPALDPEHTAKYVEKVFTYATPHNGITAEFRNMNVPSWAGQFERIGLIDADNFNHARMASYLDLKARLRSTERVDWLPEERFPSRNFFCMVGTNRLDYEAAMGLSRTFVGHGSDGLVRIDNATVWGFKANGEMSAPCATAYAYRSHSGYFGIVNSEEAYQNLIRFLFGDVRADIWLDVTSVRLPPGVEKAARHKRAVNALYLFEFKAAPRGVKWLLTRRVAEEDSAACRTYRELTGAKAERKSVFLSTVFLGNRWKANPRRKSIAYQMALGIKVPEYEVDKKFWPDGHFEGSSLFEDELTAEMFPPDRQGADWTVVFTWRSTPQRPRRYSVSPGKLDAGTAELVVPFDQPGQPGITGNLRIRVALWNQ